MPEPQTGDEKRLSEMDDKFDLDRADPFDNGHGKSGFIRHARCLLTCFLPMMEIVEEEYSYISPLVFMLPSHWIGWSNHGSWTVSFVFSNLYTDNLPARGFCPAASTLRSTIGKVVCSYIVICPLGVWVTSAAMGGRRSVQGQTFLYDAHAAICGWGAQVMYYHPLLCACLWWAPRKYGTRSFYHRYCCEYFQHARILRVCFISTLLGFNAYILGARANSLDFEFDSKAFVQFVFPVIIFGFKRFQFMMQVPVTQDDAPFKNYTFILMAYFIIFQLNISVASAANAVSAYGDIASFVLIDWALFFFRVGLLLRVGQKAFPGVVRTLLVKTLENIPRPMFKSAESLGDATAMRLHQAYLCVCEGISLTVSFLFVAAYVIMPVLISPSIMFIRINSPMRSAIVPIIYIISDGIQDVASNYSCGKFSNWSFVYYGMFRSHYIHVCCFMSLLIGKFAQLGLLRAKAIVLANRKYWLWYPNYQSPSNAMMGGAHTQMQN